MIGLGVSLARLSTATPTQSGSVRDGTVTLGSTAIANCPVAGLLPNGTSPTPCTFTATYSGSVPAYVAVDVIIEAQAGAGGTKLYNPTDSSNDLQVSIGSTTPSVTYTVPTSATTCPTGAPAGSSCYELDNELVSTATFSASGSIGFSVSVKLPTTSPTGYEGGTAQISLITHAVQAAHNTLSCTSTPTAGQACTPSGSFRWS